MIKLLKDIFTFQLSESLYTGIDFIFLTIMSGSLIIFLLSRALWFIYCKFLRQPLRIEKNSQLHIWDSIPMQKANILSNIIFLCLLGFLLFQPMRFYVDDFSIVSQIGNPEQVKMSVLSICFIVLCVFCLIILSYGDFEARFVELMGIPVICLMFCFMIRCSNIINFFLYLEIISMYFYFIASLHNKGGSSLYYSLINIIGTSFIIFGISNLYIFCGSYIFSEIDLYLRYALMDSDISLTSYFPIFFIVLGFVIKLAGYPFHVWGLQVFSGSCDFAVIVFNVISKPLYGFAFVKLYFSFFYQLFGWYWVVFSIAAIGSIFCGTLGTIHQYSVKGFLAFSSLGSTGIFFLCFVGNDIMLTVLGCLYLFSYSILIGLFLCLIIFVSKRLEPYPSIGQQRGLIRNLSDLSGLFGSSPALGGLLGLILFSLAGLPPFLGFMTKILLAMQLGFNVLYSLMLFLLLISIPMSFYFLDVIRILFRLDFSGNFFFSEKKLNYCFSLIIFLILNIFLFVFAGSVGFFFYSFVLAFFLGDLDLKNFHVNHLKKIHIDAIHSVQGFIGHSRVHWNPYNRRFCLFFIKLNDFGAKPTREARNWFSFACLNIHLSGFGFRKALQVISSIAGIRGSQFLFVGLESLSHLMKTELIFNTINFTAFISSICFVPKWIPGMLSNLDSFATYHRNSFFNIRSDPFNKNSFASRLYFGIYNIRSFVKGIRYGIPRRKPRMSDALFIRPAAAIFLNCSGLNRWGLQEARRSGVLSVGLIDSDVGGIGGDFLVHTGTASKRAVEFYFHVFCDVIQAAHFIYHETELDSIFIGFAKNKNVNNGFRIFRDLEYIQMLRSYSRTNSFALRRFEESYSKSFCQLNFSFRNIHFLTHANLIITQFFNSRGPRWISSWIQATYKYQRALKHGFTRLLRYGKKILPMLSIFHALAFSDHSFNKDFQFHDFRVVMNELDIWKGRRFRFFSNLTQWIKRTIHMRPVSFFSDNLMMVKMFLGKVLNWKLRWLLNNSVPGFRGRYSRRSLIRPFKLTKRVLRERGFGLEKSYIGIPFSILPNGFLFFKADFIRRKMRFSRNIRSILSAQNANFYRFGKRFRKSSRNFSRRRSIRSVQRLSRRLFFPILVKRHRYIFIRSRYYRLHNINSHFNSGFGFGIGFINMKARRSGMGKFQGRFFQKNLLKGIHLRGDSSFKIFKTPQARSFGRRNGFVWRSLSMTHIKSVNRSLKDLFHLRPLFVNEWVKFYDLFQPSPRRKSISPSGILEPLSSYKSSKLVSINNEKILSESFGIDGFYNSVISDVPCLLQLQNFVLNNIRLYNSFWSSGAFFNFIARRHIDIFSFSPRCIFGNEFFLNLLDVIEKQISQSRFGFSRLLLSHFKSALFFNSFIKRSLSFQKFLVEDFLLGMFNLFGRHREFFTESLFLLNLTGDGIASGSRFSLKVLKSIKLFRIRDLIGSFLTLRMLKASKKPRKALRFVKKVAPIARVLVCRDLYERNFTLATRFITLENHKYDRRVRISRKFLNRLGRHLNVKRYLAGRVTIAESRLLNNAYLLKSRQNLSKALDLLVDDCIAQNKKNFFRSKYSSMGRGMNFLQFLFEKLSNLYVRVRRNSITRNVIYRRLDVSRKRDSHFIPLGNYVQRKVRIHKFYAKLRKSLGKKRNSGRLRFTSVKRKSIRSIKSSFLLRIFQSFLFRLKLKSSDLSFKLFSLNRICRLFLARRFALLEKRINYIDILKPVTNGIFYRTEHLFKLWGRWQKSRFLLISKKLKLHNQFLLGGGAPQFSKKLYAALTGSSLSIQKKHFFNFSFWKLCYFNKVNCIRGLSIFDTHCGLLSKNFQQLFLSKLLFSCKIRFHFEGLKSTTRKEVTIKKYKRRSKSKKRIFRLIPLDRKFVWRFLKNKYRLYLKFCDISQRRRFWDFIFSVPFKDSSKFFTEPTRYFSTLSHFLKGYSSEFFNFENLSLGLVVNSISFKNQCEDLLLSSKYSSFLYYKPFDEIRKGINVFSDMFCSPSIFSTENSTGLYLRCNGIWESLSSASVLLPAISRFSHRVVKPGNLKKIFRSLGFKLRELKKIFWSKASRRIRVGRFLIRRHRRIRYSEWLTRRFNRQYALRSLALRFGEGFLYAIIRRRRQWHFGDHVYIPWLTRVTGKIEYRRRYFKRVIARKKKLLSRPHRLPIQFRPKDKISKQLRVGIVPFFEYDVIRSQDTSFFATELDNLCFNFSSIHRVFSPRLLRHFSKSNFILRSPSGLSVNKVGLFKFTQKSLGSKRLLFKRKFFTKGWSRKNRRNANRFFGLVRHSAPLRRLGLFLLNEQRFAFYRTARSYKSSLAETNNSMHSIFHGILGKTNGLKIFFNHIFKLNRFFCIRYHKKNFYVNKHFLRLSRKNKSSYKFKTSSLLSAASIHKVFLRVLRKRIGLPIKDPIISTVDKIIKLQERISLKRDLVKENKACRKREQKRRLRYLSGSISRRKLDRFRRISDSEF